MDVGEYTKRNKDEIWRNETEQGQIERQRRKDIQMERIRGMMQQ